MIKPDQLTNVAAELGLLIGLLTEDEDGNFSFQSEWFSNPVCELKQSPTRVKGLLTVLNSLFPATPGTQLTLIDPNQVWSDICADGLSTGFCLITPKSDATSGVIGLGVFEQMALN